MNKKIYLSIIVFFLGFSNIALAELKPFYEEINNEWHCGYKNESGKIIIPIKRYEYCGDFSEGLAYVGKIATPLVEYENTGYKHLQGFIDQNGDLIIPVEHEAVEYILGVDFRSFSEGLVAVYRNGKYGYMNKMRELVIPYRYEYANDFENGLAIVRQNDKYGAINRLGEIIVPISFNHLGSYSDGLAIYTKENHWNDNYQYGFLDKEGNISIKASWDDACQFSEGLAAVRVGDYETGKWGIINKSGNYIIKPEYDVPRIQTWSESEYDNCYYENGSIDMYKYTDRNNPHESSITRYTLNTQGNVINRKFYSSWESIIEEFIENNKQ